MQIEKCKVQWSFEKEMLILVLAVVQQAEDAVKPRQLAKFRFHSRFQIAEHVMFSMTRPIDLIILVVRISTQDQLNGAIR
jgi:hypothetical protein